MRSRRIGTWTFGLLLVITGAVLLYGNITGVTVDIVRYWPAALVLLGLELLILQLTGPAEGGPVRIGCMGVTVLIIIALVGIVSTFGAYSYDLPDFGRPGMVISGTRPVPADFTDVTTVRVVVGFGAVNVLPVTEGEVPRVSVEVVGEASTEGDARKLLEAIDIDVETVAGVMTVTVRGETGEQGRRVRADLELLLLPHVELKVDSRFGDVVVSGLSGGVSVDTTFGDVDLQGLTGPVTVETDFGDLEARNLRGGLSFRSEHGHVNCEQLGGDVTVKTTHGRVTVRRPAAKVLAESTHGAVRIYYESPPEADCLARSTHGAVLVEVPRSSKVTVHAVSERAAARTDLPLQVVRQGTRNQITGDLNGGGPNLQIRSEYASVELRGR